MSKHSLGRKSLAVLMAERLAQDIAEGEWGERLPGYRVLSGHYEVSDRTSQQAVALLENQGVVESAQAGKRRRILRAGKSSRKKQHLLMISDATITPDKEDLQLYSDISEYWLKRGRGRVKRATGDLSRNEHPEAMISQWVAQYAATHLIIFNAPAAWIKAIDRMELPSYYLGGLFALAKVPLSRLPGSSHKVAHTFSQVMNRLKDLGHTRLLIPFNHTRIGFRDEVRDAMLEIHQGDLSAEFCKVATPEFKEFNPESWLGYWERSFLMCRPTVVILSDYCSLVSLYAYCGQKGIVLGRDLMMVCVYGDDILEWHRPRPTYLKYPYHESLKDFKSWVRQGCLLRDHTLLKMEWVEGDTMGKGKV